MLPPKSILDVWHKFDQFPMETLTKVWFYHQSCEKKQRSVALMKAHRAQYKTSGNCYDLSLWLLDEFQKEGIEAYPIGEKEPGHAAVIALDEHGNRFLCDLGYQWLKPILVDPNSEDYTNESMTGFFAGAKVQVKRSEEGFNILYHRPNGKVSTQSLCNEPMSMDDFLQQAELSQRTLKPYPLCKCRIPYKGDAFVWEFYDWSSFWSMDEGLIDDPSCPTVADWAARIHQHTGYDQKILREVLTRMVGMRK
ncbi:hypothetical protein [Shouchella lonarensis]|uniref:Uncharacterized protein n=1 Tax=Shouchella lonarensis TaxID=1464122 RepID=A0A1G6ND57_9BACI|nr:hypothetical protein [Shouchella lonarensis]SDC65307.1 hypothetical protein SAMN05421737_11237 [Shouchella lonarensis]